MAATKDDIRGWLKRGHATAGATHMLVLCDTFDHSDYPVYVESKEAAEARYKSPGEMQRVMEVYNLAFDDEEQLAEHRAFHF